MLAVKTTELSRNFSSIADRVVKGEKIVVSYPERENLVLITEKEYRELEELKTVVSKREEAVSLFKKMRSKVVESGDFMTDEEINAEIEAARAGA